MEATNIFSLPCLVPPLTSTNEKTQVMQILRMEIASPDCSAHQKCWCLYSEGAVVIHTTPACVAD